METSCIDYLVFFKFKSLTRPPRNLHPSRLTDSKTEPISPSRHPASERTNTNHRLNMQTEKYVKESNSAPARGEASQSASTPNSLLLALVPTNTYKIPILESILEKTLGYVLRESNQLRKKSDVHHYIGSIVS